MKVWTIAAMATATMAALNGVQAQSDTECKEACPEIFKPVCGSDGVTYENQCMFDFAKCSTQDESLSVASEGNCPTGSGSEDGISCDSPVMCTAEVDPVCGSDGKTYSNECQLLAAACQKESLTVASKGECDGSTTGSDASSCSKSCPKDFKPVCGSDGKTYSNECELKNMMCTKETLTLASEGECGSANGSGDGMDSSSGSASVTPEESSAMRAMAAASVCATTLVGMLVASLA